MSTIGLGKKLHQKKKIPAENQISEFKKRTKMATETNKLNLIIEFCGGLEMLFDNQRKIQINLERSQEWTMRKLIKYLCDNHLQKQPEMFRYEDSVRPGILITINETDWELLGENDYKLQPNDNVLFISTLHGG